MYEFQILPFWNNLKNFTRSLRPSDSLPPVSPPAPPISPSLPSHFFKLYFRRNCKPNFSSTISCIFTEGSHVVQVSLLLLSHWFLKISFNICKFAFLSQLLHQASTVKRLFEQMKQIRTAHGPLKLLGEGADRAARGREGAVQLEAGERSWFVWLVVYMLLSCWQSLSLWSTSRKELLRS